MTNIRDVSNTLEDIYINNRLINTQATVDTLFTKVLEVFRYENLPLTIPKDVIETLSTRNGACVIYEHEDNLFVTATLPSSEFDVYNRPTRVKFHHTNEGERVSLERTVGIDAVLYRNDSNQIGLEQIINEFAVMSAQAKITMLRNLVDLRGNYIIHAKDENSYRSALEFENSVRRGDTAVLMAEQFEVGAISEGVEIHHTPIPNSPASQTIELYQYIQSIYYGELGIDLNNNMKREYVSNAEIDKSTGMPFIHNMLRVRQEAIRDINALFGTDITVALSGEWREDNDDDVFTDNEEMEAEGGESNEATDPEAEPETEPEATDEEEAPEEDDGDSTVEPEVDDVTEEELTEATEAMLGEDDGLPETDTTTDDRDTGDNVPEDNA